MPNHYCFYGLPIYSDVELPELPSLSHTEGEAVSIRFGHVPSELDGLNVVCHSGNQIAPGHFLMRIKNIASCYAREGRDIIISPHTRDLDAIRPFLLGSMMAAILHQRGCHLLHASAVSMHGKAFLFAAPSGGGKSTTAASLMSQGATLLCDDVCLLSKKDGDYKVTPAYPVLKLRDDSIRKLYGHTSRTPLKTPLNPVEQEVGAPCKFKVSPSRLHEDFSTQAVPVAAVYMLKRAESPSIRPMNGFEAITALKSVVYRDGIMSGEGNAKLFFEFSTGFVGHVPVKQAQTGKRMTQHGEFIERIIADLQQAVTG